MGRNTGWSKGFAAGWSELQGTQRWHRAKYLFEEGVKQGHSPDSIARATESTDWPLAAPTVRQYLDFYGVGLGVGSDEARPDAVLQASGKDLRYAISQYEASVSDGEINAFMEQTGASKGIAKRILEKEAIGEALKSDGLIDSDGRLTVERPEKEQDKERRAQEKAIREARDSHSNWMKAFDTYWGRINDFVGFLKHTKQDAMRDSTVGRKLRWFADEFDKQSERFETGHAKFKAREDAAVRRKVK